jgi:antibiotic biosynthesis monooxygenase (ABM) superfamily enzyme
VDLHLVAQILLGLAINAAMVVVMIYFVVPFVTKLQNKLNERMDRKGMEHFLKKLEKRRLEEFKNDHSNRC